MAFDYHVRTQIRECLEIKYFRNHKQPFAAHIAFQLAFCYQIGFGVESDDSTSHMWLRKSAKQSDDLEAEKEAVQPARWKSSRMQGYEGLVWVDLIHEYRTQGLENLENARVECERVIRDMTRVFGEVHSISLMLYKTFGNLLDELGELLESKALRMWVREQIEKTHGINHPYYIESILDVFKSHEKLGELKEAQLLLEEVLQKSTESIDSTTVGLIKHCLATTFRKQGRWKEAEELLVPGMEALKRVFGQEHPSYLANMNNLALLYQNQGRWKEAEELFVQVMETIKRILGQEHPDTLTGMGNLALTYQGQGRWREAEKLEVRVVEMRKRVLGQEHPNTLTSMANLASTYLSQGRWKEAEEMKVKVMETRKRVLGQDHPDTLTSRAYLASAYRKQGRWKEAEGLGVQAMDVRKRVLGQEHPDTLASMANLASTFWNQGRWEEAEELEVQVIETFNRVLGQKHPDTLTTMSHLASTYRRQGRWMKAEELEVQVMETRKRVLGQEHPATLTSIANLATTYRSQGRWTEAEELQIDTVNQLRTTLGGDHPSTVAAIAKLASFHEERAAPASFRGSGGLVERLRDGILRVVSSWSLDQGKDGQERLKSSFETSQKQATEHGDEITDEVRHQLALATSLEVCDNYGTGEERPLDPLIEADVENQANAGRLQRALAMSTTDGNDSGDSFKATSIELDEGNETDEERLERALAMSMMDENDCE